MSFIRHSWYKNLDMLETPLFFILEILLFFIKSVLMRKGEVCRIVSNTIAFPVIERALMVRFSNVVNIRSFSFLVLGKIIESVTIL
mgnify:FL=1